MDRTMTVSVKGLLVTAVVLLALLAAYLLGGAGGAAPSPAQAAPAAAERPAREDARTLRMVGTGEATVVPDQLGFTLSVTAKQPALDDALGGPAPPCGGSSPRWTTRASARPTCRPPGCRCIPSTTTRPTARPS